MKNKKVVWILVVGIIAILLVMTLSTKFVVDNNVKKEESANRIESKVLFDKEIKSIKIRFAPGYNIATAEAINYDNEFVKIHTFDVEGDSFNIIKKNLSNVKSTTFNFKECNCVYMIDYYQIIVNDDTIFTLGNEYGALVYGEEKYSDMFDVNSELNNTVTELIKNYSNENIYKRIDNVQGVSVTIGDEVRDIIPEDYEVFTDFEYFYVSQDKDYLTYDTIKFIIDFHNGKKLYIYDSAVIAYLLDENGESSFVHVDRDYGDNLYGYLINS